MSFASLAATLPGRFGLYLASVVVASVLGLVVFASSDAGLGLLIFVLMLLIPSVVVAALVDVSSRLVATMAAGFFGAVFWTWRSFSVDTSSTAALIFVVLAFLLLLVAVAAIILRRIMIVRRSRSARSVGPSADQPPAP